MPSAVTIGVFASAALVLLVIPGPSVLFIVTRTAEHGRIVGLASVLGIHTGTVVHVVAAAVGVSALLVQSATAFTLVKLCGAAYLIALGVRRLLAPPDEVIDADRTRRSVSPRRAFRQGVIVEVLNPKVALFFLAFLPQFVDPSRGRPLVQILLLGAVYIAMGMVTDGTYALAAATIARAARRRTRRRLGTRLSGLVYIALGLTAALTRRSESAPA
jgi:threonine/homoserine/homoserine lactone efflux protein